MADQLTILRAALAGRYTIERKLGAGGMATVYLADDLKHGRKVAIKVLRPEVASALGPERFRREIEIAANLTHPHVLPLYDSGQADGFLFYTMPYVDGESLRERLTREKRLPIDDALTIARQVADALHSAHQQGVIHRDIKPENILLEAGHAVVTDFGIARAVRAAAGEALTKTGMAVGTPAYMSPEQAAGRTELDGRSDVYSLGCVAYEMLGGDPPFTGSDDAILARKIVEPPPRLRVLRDTVPPWLERVVTTSLARAPADRFATAREFAERLNPEHSAHLDVQRSHPGRQPRRAPVLAAVALATLVMSSAAVWWSHSWGGRGGGLDRNVVAVFPFRVTASDTSLDYLANGMVVLLHARLTGEGVPRAVDPTTATVAWERRDTGERGLSREEALQLAGRLGAGQVVLGSAVGLPSQLALSATVLTVPDGEVRAEGVVTGRDGELPMLIDQLVAQLLFLQTPTPLEHLSVLSDSLPANKEYLAGKNAERRQRWWQAQRHFERALEIDSTFALAALGLVEVGEAIGVDARFVQRAWALRDRLPTRDRTYLYSLSWVGPDYPAPSTWAELFAAKRAAAQATPDRAEVWHQWGSWLLVNGAYAGVSEWLQQATAALDSALALNPTYLEALTWRLEAAILDGDTAQIRVWADRYFPVDSSDVVDARRWWVAVALRDTAQLRAARARLDEFSNLSIGLIVRHSITEGIPLDDAEHAIERRWREGVLPQSWREALAWGRAILAAARGRARDAAALLDSVVATGATDSVSMAASMINLALIEPGYDSAGADAARMLSAMGDTTTNPDVICNRELWRVTHGDTIYTRTAIARFNRIVEDWHRPDDMNDHVGKRGVCPLLLEAMLERAAGGPGDSPAVDRLESLMRQGPRRPVNAALANIAIARWREEQGDLQAALAAVRRHPRSWGGYKLLGVLPLIRQEGRLAALSGDTAAAIRAYNHYLTLRTVPDPGPLSEEVDRVRIELADLVAEHRPR